MLTGALHIHSTYSDGEFTLEELRDIFTRAECRFACITDHAESFDKDKLEAYRAECEARSDAQFRFIPGLEFACVNRMHILGYGTTALIDSTDPQEVIRKINALGGISVIAHPRDNAFASIEAFETLPDGIETWNTKYDGRWAPRPATFALLRRLRNRRPDVGAFYGQDLHWRNQYRRLLTAVDCAGLERQAVFRALRAGDYVGLKEGLGLPSSGDLPVDTLAAFAHVRGHFERLRRWVSGTKTWADRIGITLPAAMKAHLRRFF